MTFKLLLATSALAASPVLAQTTPAAGAQPTTPGATTTPQASTTATAQTGTQPGATGGAVAQGATVYDPQGGVVGRIESVSGDMAVVATQKTKVQLPKSSFAAGTKGPTIAMTQVQLDQAAAQASPQAAAGAGATAGATGGTPKVTQGAAVTDLQGGAVGTVSEVDAQFATVTLTTGGKVRLPLNGFGAGANGGLRVSMTAAQLQAAGAASGTPSK